MFAFQSVFRGIISDSALGVSRQSLFKASHEPLRQFQRSSCGLARLNCENNSPISGRQLTTRLPLSIQIHRVPLIPASTLPLTLAPVQIHRVPPRLPLLRPQHGRPPTPLQHRIRALPRTPPSQDPPHLLCGPRPRLKPLQPLAQQSVVIRVRVATMCDDETGEADGGVVFWLREVIV
jgi:hypothetical protein